MVARNVWWENKRRKEMVNKQEKWWKEQKQECTCNLKTREWAKQQQYDQVLKSSKKEAYNQKKLNTRNDDD